MTDSILWALPIAIAVIALAAFALLRGRSGRTGRIGPPYQRAKALFSAAERSFLGALDQAIGPEHRVFGKVRVADIAAVKPGLGQSARQGALNRIAAKHFDFIVCRAGDLTVVCAVELNDSSHSGKRARARDEFLADVCRAIELPLLTIPAKAAYSVEELRGAFESAINPAPAQKPPGDRPSPNPAAS